MLRECVTIREKVLAKNHWRIAEARRVLAECLIAQGAAPASSDRTVNQPDLTHRRMRW